MSNLVLKEMGYRIKEYRKKAKLTQEQLAEQAQITAGYVSKLECGNIWPSMSLIYKFAEIFDCSIYCLIPKERGNKRNLPDEISALLSDATIKEWDALHKYAQFIVFNREN